MILTHHGINSIRRTPEYVQEYDEDNIPPLTSTGTVPLDRVGWSVSVPVATCTQDRPYNKDNMGWSVSVAGSSTGKERPYDKDNIGWSVSVAAATETVVV